MKRQGRARWKRNITLLDIETRAAHNGFITVLGGDFLDEGGPTPMPRDLVLPVYSDTHVGMIKDGDTLE